jgi:hypothetical protein
VQVAAPFSLANQNDAIFGDIRGVWVQIDVTSAGWPLLQSDTYYWVVLTPGATITVSNGGYNGALWVGINQTLAPFLPVTITRDPDLFTARQLSSARFVGDSAFCSSTTAAVNFVGKSTNWPRVVNASKRFTNWRAVRGSAMRYGLQLIGWEATPSLSPSTSSECRFEHEATSALCVQRDARCAPRQSPGTLTLWSS